MKHILIHTLKTWPEYFYRVLHGQKNFEVRKNDRDFQIGDEVILEYFDPDNPESSKDYRAPIKIRITYLLNGGQFGIEPGYCVFGFEKID